MNKLFRETIENNRQHFFSYINSLLRLEKKLFLQGELITHYKKYSAENKNGESLPLLPAIGKIQEALFSKTHCFLDVRESLGETTVYLVSVEHATIETVEVYEYLRAKELHAKFAADDDMVTLDFKPFYEKSPLVRDTKMIGHGFEYLNRFLSSQMFHDINKWRTLLFNFLRSHQFNNEQLLMNDRIENTEQMREALNKALELLEEFDAEDEFNKVKHKLQELGFEKGLGRNVALIRQSLRLLDSLNHSPDHISLQDFIARIPMVFNIAVVSTHGYFAQDGVLGLPDTGGQVVYVLDQVKALEQSVTESLYNAGIDHQPKILVLTRLIPDSGDNTCDQRLERVHDTKNTWILRVPFRKHNSNVTDKWISRFEIWPYLEEFAEDAAIQLQAEFGGKPHLIIGNYSDGNLVAYLLAKRFDVIQAGIAHALEKNKYLYSALYWKDNEEKYNFSLQFTADLLAMNSADFIMTSTRQEVVGTADSIGQYESYKHFTMPELYRVVDGMNPRHIKYNIVPPGVNMNIYYPYTEKQRLHQVRQELEELFFGNIEDADTFGTLKDPGKTPLMTMSRLDNNKNITAMVRWFGQSPEMQKHANLIIIAGKIDESLSSDREEIEEIKYMHQLIKEYNLQDKIRWVGKLFRKDQASEVYRVTADHEGIFVQPGLFEGFGLTVLEAMISGLPVFATKYGGPLEIIHDGINGFHIDPVNDEESTEKLVAFLKKMSAKESAWKQISENSIKRVREAFNWDLHTSRLLLFSKIYGFWKFSSDMERRDMDAYLDIIYHTIFKPRARALLEKQNTR